MREVRTNFLIWTGLTGHSLERVALGSHDELVLMINGSDLLADMEGESVWLLLSIPCRIVEVQLADVAMLEVLGEAHTVVGEMNFFAAGADEVLALLVEVEKLLDEGCRVQ